MEKRYRQQPFQSPLSLEGFEEDPERALWIPGRKRIFLPRQREAWELAPISWDIETHRGLDFQNLRGLMEAYCDCSPSRSEYLGIRRDFIVPRTEPREGTWEGFTRSKTPQFRSSRSSWGRDW